jgi:hypothetical protein
MPKRTRRNPQTRKRARRAIAAGVLVEVGGIWLRTGRLGGEVAVRCRSGHLFTTLWIPALSVKSLRLGAWRVQRCPVGRHWSLVTPLRDSTLTAEERQLAREHHDLRVP